ncbi:PAS domain S-box protein [Rhodopirellula sp. JC740]|uniref:histidine kinase n=1 Tax=Rhodopirellula halodulae TaxID=2894198 RepID=A0ABS8NQZ1_9BACT|nr:ATP-binding protein [Rhodopirellula sp. JC740]MCC9644876.1 PAS domain S-box protein [Rhodopirellula sp. JC740]
MLMKQDARLRPSPICFSQSPIRSFGPAIAGMVLILVMVVAGASSWLVGLVSLVIIGLLLVFRHWHSSQQDDAVSAFVRDSNEEVQKWQERLRCLHAETRQNASALLQLSDGVIVLSKDFSVLLINPSAVRLLGLKKRDALLGRCFTELVRVPQLLASIRSAVKEHQPQEFTVEVHDQGTIRPLRVRVDLIDTGEEPNLQLSLRDETESRRVEEMRREFIANVSHELKTPLAAIKGYAETVELAVQDDPDAALHFMKQITSQCLRLERLVHEMMQLARAQSGPANLHLSSVSLTEIVEDAIRTYEPVAIANDLELVPEVFPGKAKIIADREATLTIANNLIGNAIRYTPAGGEVRVSIEEDSDRWVLAVEDTGVGIPYSEHQRVFERFYRGSRNEESGKGGTGLGLAIVKHLTQAQDGEVSLESVPGQGSCFRVRLPAVASAELNRV